MSREPLLSIALSSSVVLAFGLFWWVGRYAESFFAGRFRSRFPEKTLGYTADQLAELVKSDLGTKYVYPILFPLDLIVMVALAGSMSAASWHWINQTYPAAAWLALFIPGVYLLSDLIEDCLLARLLLRGNPAEVAASVSILKTFTAIKLVSIVCAIALTLTAFVAWIFRAWLGS